MSVCVNINSKEFKDLAKRLDVSERSLEGIIHEYINAEGSDGSFPSDYYILSRLEGQPLTNVSEAAQKLIDAKYKDPIVVNTYEEAQAVMREMMQYFEPKNVGIKETNDGKFQVTLGPVYTSRLERTGTINTVSTPIKEEYRGKLIFAQSGTGKTSIADNVNVIDSDYLLGQVLGVPTALAGNAFKLLGYTQKTEVGNRYRELIRQKVSEGKTVVTANLSMLPEADVIVYNESAELSDSRTSAEDRANQFSNTEYQTEAINRINEFIEQNPNKESYKLGKNQFLGNVILSDSNFNILSERLKSNTLNDMLNDFVHNFGINIEEYQGELPLFDAVERVIKARSAEDLPDAVGEAVAFMMQYNPDVKNYIAERVVADGKRTREEMFNSNGSVKHIYNTPPFAPVKAEYFKEIGKEIAKQLRRLYTEANTIHTEEIKDPFIKRIWNIISEFFNKILPRKEMVSSLSLAQERLNNYAKKAARGILSNNEGLVIASLSKPETKELATPVNVAEAFANNPYERGIIEKMTSEGIKLAGSTSIAVYGRVLRPAENPFHDLDFASPNWTAAQLEEMLKRQFGNYQPTQVISDASGEVSTRSYVVLNRPFRIEPSKLGESFFRLVDTETGEVLGSLNHKKTEFVSLSEGVQGKVLDFFVSPEKYPSRTYTFNGVDYLIADPRNALDAKVSWMRLKDIFDFNRAVMNDFAPTELPAALREYSPEMQEIKEAAISNGTFMKAPNGKPTNLTERQWLQVRTKAFKDWFGDWESVAPKNTKDNLINQNGEINWEYFEQILDSYHNSQPDSMFAKGRTTLATREEKHFEGEKNTLNHIKFVTQSMLDLFEGKFDADLPFVSEARASLQNQKDLMVLAAMFHDAAKPYRHGDIHGWESADIIRDVIGIDYNNRLAEWAVRHHMAMPFSHKAEFNLSNPEALEVARNMARDAKRVGIDAQTAINAFVLINAADIINGREITVEDNWAKKAKASGNTKFGNDISVKAVLTVELKEKVDLLKKAFADIKDEDFGNSEYNYRNQSRFDYISYPEGGRADKKLPYLSNVADNTVSKVVDDNGEPWVVYHGSSKKFRAFASKYAIGEESGFFFSSDRKYSEQFGSEMYPVFLNMRTPLAAGDIPLHRDTIYSIFAESPESADYLNSVDGIIGNDMHDGKFTPSTGLEFMVYRPSQIKSATENYGEFDAQTDDIYYNIEGKSLKEFLRDKGLIHTYDPSLGDTDKKAMYVTKGDGTYSMQSLINQIYTTLRMYRISPNAVSFSKTKAGNAMKITFNEDRDSIERMSDRNLKDIKKTVDFLQARIPALKGRVHYASKVEAQRALGRALRRGENSFVKNGHVYLIGRRYTQDIAIEECLHPFTATLKYENPFLYNRLLEEARTFFPKLWEDIVSNYSGKEFTAEDRAIELVTQALARNFREAFNETKNTERKTFNQYVKQFINWFKSLFYRVNPMTGNQIIDLHTISPEMSFRELAELINTSDTEFSVGFEEKVRYNKERIPINADEKEFITESVKIPGISEEALSNVEKAFNAYQQTDGETQVTISENAYYNLPTRIIEDPAHPDEVTDTVEQFFEDSDAPIHKDGKVTLPYYAYAILYAAKALAPAYEQIKNSVGTESYLEAVQSAIEDYENFYEFIERIGGEFYYTDSRQGLLFDENGNPTEDAQQENGLSKPATQLVRPELTAFQEKADNMNTQLNNLLSSDLVTQEEVRDLAEQAVYFISDSITEFLENPNKVFEIFKNLRIKDGKPMTDAELNAEVEKIKGMSREELAKYITHPALLNLAKERLFSPQGNPSLNTRRLIKKANLIYNNFDAITTFASDAFTSVEDFVINSVMDEYSIREDAQPLSNDIDEERTAEEAQENGNYQEHWQVESRTKDAISRMSQLVKSALNKLYQVRINPENGKEERIASEFGVAKRVNVKDATSSILRWTQGAESLSHMVELLKAKSKENPWVNQLISKLEDTSGKEADFQSQFYGVMATPFQSYSLVLREKENGGYTYKSIVANERPALKEVTQSIEVAYKTNTHPLFDGGRIRLDTLETLISIANDLVNKAQHSLEENNREEIVDLLTKAAATLGYTAEEGAINMALDSNDVFVNMVNNLKKISDNLNAAKAVENYDPFKYRGTNNISGFLKDFLLPITDKLEDTAVSSFYDSGKMYQSYVTPSYLTVMMNKFTGTDERFQQFLEEEYGQYEWFRSPSGWRNEWLETLDGLSQSERKELFKHKVQLNFNKHNYMKNMTDIEYALSIITEYFSKAGNTKGNRFVAWYRVPMMSNKPSSEFISMYAYTGAIMKGRLASGFSKIFQQELSRIQTVDIRGYDKSNPNFIKNFDKNGKKFMMLDFFNKYLSGGREANSELGMLINKAIKEGTEYDATTNKGLSVEENARLDKLVTDEIIATMDARADRIIEQWRSEGILEAAKQIANIGKEDSVVEEKLREFIWNDTFAAMNILELMVTDPAYYKDAEDLQKRLAQIHAPGTRANIEATDYNGNRVTDGKFRTILLKDFDDFVSNIVENLNIVFDKKISEATTEAQKEAFRALKDSLTRPRTYKKDGSVDDPGGAFWNINVADAQGYSSPASYRKKAFIFGRWSRSAEEIYNKLRENKYTYSDLQTAFQPLKPFVYGQIEKPALDINRRDIATPLQKLKVPVQFKNSEYLLIMADAILQKEDTGRPNLLRAIYEVMEESAEKDPQRGIDTVQFESTCKSGLMGAIDIKQFSNMKGGETAAKLALTQAIYNEDGTYNTDTYVYEVPFENYAIQQEVPAHFKNHAQAHGSQIRYIVISDLETQDSNDNPVTYDYFDRGEKKQLSADEFKREYENNIAENIEEGLNDLAKELGIGDHYLSKKDRNIALSKVLLEEILSSPRYGVELAIACTVDSNTGEFNIPLGDPIQSKRIEQLINSVIKNRVNKQKVAGGPVVQVTNFGTSKELNIRFNSKEGGLLMTRAEFEKSGKEGTFEDYIKNNQAGIAYYEVFAPIFANELFEKFADKDGNIDIETIEMINPDLLKMIGYRIPTEDKYSMAPLKIVGFLPREAGDGIMLPNDITLLTGSDFDVDKFYLMRKEISIATRMNSQESVTSDNFNEAAQEFTKNNRDEVVKYLKSQIPNRETIQLTEEEAQAVRDKYAQAIDAENRRHQDAIDRINEDADTAYDAANEGVDRRANENKYSEAQEEKVYSQIDKSTERRLERENAKHDNQIYKIEQKIERALEKARDRKLDNIVTDFLSSNIFSTRGGDSMFRALKEAYVKYMFDYVEETEGVTYRNNKIVDMTWAVLTNETTASKMLTPGGFEPQKRMGYLISAYQNPAVNKTWEELNAIEDVEDLKSLCYTEKNLSFIDTHLQFYKQNSAASTALGMAAVQKVAHAVLESNGYQVDVSKALHLDEDETFTIAGKTFGGRMELDAKYNDAGALIGRTLGEFVAMFADAVKDPVANLMNINNTTMPIVTTLIRLGMPFEKAALFISQPIIKRVLSLYNSENISNFVRLNDVIERQLKQIEKDNNIGDESVLKELDTITEDELIKGLRRSDDAMDYKVLKFFQYINSLSQVIKAPTYITRFNSISNAVGPLIIDNLIMEYKLMNGDFSSIYDKNGNEASASEILNAHPILGGFYQTVNIARTLFDEMPTNSLNFRDMVFSANEDLQKTLFNDRKLLTKLSDFYQSYLLVASGAIPVEATSENKFQGLKYYLEQFPADFMRGKAKEIFRGNTLIDAIKVDIQKGRTVLKIDTTGLTPQEKAKLSDGWADLYRSGERGKALAEHLFYYNFFRTGIGFSPKSFMALFPTLLKGKIRGYNEAFRVHTDKFASNVSGDMVLDQFVRNNANDNKLAPKIKLGKDGASYVIENGLYVFRDKNFDFVSGKPYIKIKVNGKDTLLKRVSEENKLARVVSYEELSLLGNDGEFFEVFTDPNYKPIIDTQTVREQVEEGETDEVSPAEVDLGEGNTQTPVTADEQRRRSTLIRNILLKIFESTGRTREQSENKMKQYKDKSNEEKEGLKDKVKDFFRNRLEKLGIKYDEDLVDELYEELC